MRVFLLDSIYTKYDTKIIIALLTDIGIHIQIE